MNVAFRAVDEALPGARWRGLFDRFWPSYHRWYFGADRRNRPPRVVAEQRLRQHMPELMPTYRRLLELAGGDPEVARFLTLYRPAPYLTGCSQAVWTRGELALVRNYDYSPALWEGVLLHTAWNGRRVLAMSDCLWGALDGVNEAGLVVSLAFGGRTTVGDGFGSPLILRYILETCESADEARAVLARVGTHMAYNVTALDRRGRYFTAYLAPDRAPLFREEPVATNHQDGAGWDRYVEATSSVERERVLRKQVAEETSLREFSKSFLEAPLYSTRYPAGLGTLYTSIYFPGSGRMELHWPGQSLHRSLDDRGDTELTVELG